MYCRHRSPHAPCMPDVRRICVVWQEVRKSVEESRSKQVCRRESRLPLYDMADRGTIGGYFAIPAAYSCTKYVQLLVEEKMVDSLPCPPLDFWEIGARYADDWKEHNSQMVASRMAIPCCDKDGNTLPTPMGATRA